MVNKGSPEHYVASLLESRNVEYWEAQVKRLGNGSAEDFEARNDLAVALIRVGKAEQALPILLEIERAHPGRYETASNLGTAYELLGDVDKAHEWIETGIERNPRSHYGSEWIHLQILETKKRIEEQPDWLVSNRILPADTETPRETADRLSDLEYQLHERLSLVAPPDQIVAALLFELGDLQGRMGSAERARAVYQLSLDYGPANEESVKQSLAQAQDAVESRRWLVSLLNSYGHPVTLAFGGGCTLLFLIVGLLLWRRRRSKSLQTSQELP